MSDSSIESAREGDGLIVTSGPYVAPAPAEITTEGYREYWRLGYLAGATAERARLGLGHPRNPEFTALDINCAFKAGIQRAIAWLRAEGALVLYRQTGDLPAEIEGLAGDMERSLIGTSETR